MEREELEARFTKALDEIKANYAAFSMAQRMHARKGSKAMRAVSEMTVYRMQHKISLERLGIDVETARQCARDGLAYVHMDRHRHPDSLVLKRG